MASTGDGHHDIMGPERLTGWHLGARIGHELSTDFLVSTALFTGASMVCTAYRGTLVSSCRPRKVGNSKSSDETEVAFRWRRSLMGDDGGISNIDSRFDGMSLRTASSSCRPKKMGNSKSSEDTEVAFRWRRSLIGVVGGISKSDSSSEAMSLRTASSSSCSVRGV